MFSRQTCLPSLVLLLLLTDSQPTSPAPKGAAQDVRR